MVKYSISIACLNILVRVQSVIQVLHDVTVYFTLSFVIICQC